MARGIKMSNLGRISPLLLVEIRRLQSQYKRETGMDLSSTQAQEIWVKSLNTKEVEVIVNGRRLKIIRRL